MSITFISVSHQTEQGIKVDKTKTAKQNGRGDNGMHECHASTLKIYSNLSV